MKFKVDFARGIAYKGKHGYLVLFSPKGLYIEKRGKEIYLTSKNAKVLEDSCENGK